MVDLADHVAEPIMEAILIIGGTDPQWIHCSWDHAWHACTASVARKVMQQRSPEALIGHMQFPSRGVNITDKALATRKRRAAQATTRSGPLPVTARQVFPSMSPRR
jgi:hypothetical protein